MVSPVGFKISLLQAEKDISNAELARRMGINAANVPKLRRAKRHRYKTLHKLAQAFQVPVSHFLCS